MKLFPHFIARVSGMPFTSLRGLEQRGLIDPCLQLTEAKMASKRSALQLSEALHGYIATVSDSKIQNQMINLRRKIFQGKTLQAAERERLEGLIQPDVKQWFGQWSADVERVEQLSRSFADAYAAACKQSRENLAELAQNKDLQKGLILSSQALLNNISGYQKNLDQLRKKELKTEESLLKYITRMAAKTSPFSTFTNLIHGTYNEDEAGEAMTMTVDGQHTIISSVTLNNALFGYLNTLICKVPELYRCIQIRLNPTLTLQQENYVFLTNHNNIESFQRIPHNPVVELFHELIAGQETAVSLGTLVDEIVNEEYIDAPAEEIEGYLKQLVDYGFIEFDLGVSGLDPFWDRRLRAVLTDWLPHTSLAQPLMEVLESMRNQAVAYQHADVAGRQKLLQEAHAQFRAVCMQLHEAAGLPAEERRSREELEAEAAKKIAAAAKNQPQEDPKEKKLDEDQVFQHQSSTYFHFKPEQMFYEDTTTSASIQVQAAAMQEVLAQADDLVNRMLEFDGMEEEQEKMRVFFAQQYASENRVPVMTFYEDYFRLVKIPEAKRQQEAKEKNEVAAPVIDLPQFEEKRKALNDKVSQFTDALKTKSLSLPVVHLSSRDLDPFFPVLTSGGSSRGAFIQPFASDLGLSAVLNGVFAGNGKMFSRFLHMFDDTFTDAIRADNAHEDVIRIENADASMFNANLHPPLMGREIWMPGGQNSLPHDAQVPITDLLIGKENDGSLYLIQESSGKRAEVYDLGFQGQRGRSQLFQLLAKFSPVKATQLYPAVTAVNQLFQTQENEVVRYPRVVYNQKLILQRSRWMVPVSKLPSCDAQMTDAQRFELISGWRNDLGIPDRVFIYLTNSGEQQGLNNEQLRRLGRDGYKPQFISFTSPLLVNLFADMIARVPVQLRVDEAFPGEDQMLQCNGERWVNECVVQWKSI
ncbi:MAG TPA: lantibiotic dehydratase [Luteibaculaceae bacterium]|nr:lantibiotic dehydratase [Luteibaculaceae bacterium]